MTIKAVTLPNSHWLLKTTTVINFITFGSKINDNIKQPLLRFPYNISLLSESAVIISFEQIIDVTMNDYISRLTEEIQQKPFVGFREVVPAFASLTVFFEFTDIDAPEGTSVVEFVKSKLESIIQHFDFVQQNDLQKHIVEIPVIYDGEDLAYVCKKTNLSTAEFTEIHTVPLYRVFMMGFLPGFAYLGGMDKRIAVARRDSPRLKVPAGSVGIAGEQTGVYPLESPGGWQLIGRTEMPLFTPNKKELTLLKQGDYVKFVAV